MKENTDELLIDLLIEQATHRLTDAEQTELDALENGRHDNSFDLTVSAISLIGEKGDQAMPSHLRANVRAAAERYFDEAEESSRVQLAPQFDSSTAEGKRSRLNWNWLGWAVAAAACLILVANLYLTRVQPGQQLAGGPTPTPVSEILTPAQERQKMMGSSPDMIKATVAKGNVGEITDISGDIVWSDSKQAGYVRLRGLPMNDNKKQQYQLWIFDETQSDKTPIDGGVFDVNENGEVTIPIKATLKTRKPKMFAITVEQPGGVMVSTREKIAALAKVET